MHDTVHAELQMRHRDPKAWGHTRAMTRDEGIRADESSKEGSLSENLKTAIGGMLEGQTRI